MAETPQIQLTFQDGCPDCASREVRLPPILPQPGDDFDWLLRDYDGFRMFMMEELAARFPERRRWTAADMEVVIVETLSVVLDQLSDQMDRVASEAFLETARRPQSVRRLLKLIGYDAVRHEPGLEQFKADFPSTDSDAERLERYWQKYPHRMELAREAGPRSIRTQHRMVTENDYAERLEDHPLVSRAVAWSEWRGSWMVMTVATRHVSDLSLEDRWNDLTLADGRKEHLENDLTRFSTERGLPVTDLTENPSLRTMLRPYIDAYRMAGKEVCLTDAEAVGIRIDLTIQVSPNYYQSEVRSSVFQALGNGLGGFFEPGRLNFGEDLHASDLFEVVNALEGVTAACLNTFKRVGQRFPNQADNGVIRLDGLEYAICDSNNQRPERGYLTLKMKGGQQG
ncbi:hypothetical protein ACFQY0_01475 [Haloferula chungangensis]|uniref:Uncharacterized protein n=1 Tax=Haloferula chungangensis TaxID=1048331 RepID=A0ABW2L2S4_9BACT